MSNTNTGGPAFPQKTDITLSYSGMTLRDYFAAKAMQGLVVDGVGSLMDEELADAMLKAREA